MCDELTKLSKFLKTIDRTLQDCHRRTHAFLDDDLRELCLSELGNCNEALTDLETLVAKIKKPSRLRTSARWKARLAMDLEFHTNQLSVCHEKIQQSNMCLQTILHMIIM